VTPDDPRGGRPPAGASELFANAREANVRSCVALIESMLAELGHDPVASRVAVEPADPSWEVRRGSARVVVGLVPRGDIAHLRVTSAVMTVDAAVDLLALYRALLSLNASAIRGAAFGVDGDEVQLIAERPTTDLDQGEVLDLVRRVQDYADHYDDELVARYGGKLGSYRR
jgi:hypothetical protein